MRTTLCPAMRGKFTAAVNLYTAMQSCAIMNKRLHKIRVRTEASAEMENGMEQKSGMQMIPLDTINGFPVRPGFYLENGAMALPGGVNFTVFSHNATAVWLLLFRRAECDPYAVLPFPESYRIGNVYSMIVFGLDIAEFEYAYCVDGPYDPKKGLIFDRQKILLDPYARAVAGQSVWGQKAACDCAYRARVVSNDFDWGKFRQPGLDMKDMIMRLSFM